MSYVAMISLGHLLRSFSLVGPVGPDLTVLFRQPMAKKNCQSGFDRFDQCKRTQPLLRRPHRHAGLKLVLRSGLSERGGVISSNSVRLWNKSVISQADAADAVDH